jgi:hypothetical protein
MVFQIGLLSNEPDMTSVEINFAGWAIDVPGDFLRLALNGPPEIGNEAPEVVDDLGRASNGPTEQHSTACTKRLDVVVDLAESTPDLGGDTLLAAGKRKWGTKHGAATPKRSVPRLITGTPGSCLDLAAPRRSGRNDRPDGLTSGISSGPIDANQRARFVEKP